MNDDVYSNAVVHGGELNEQQGGFTFKDQDIRSNKVKEGELEDYIFGEKVF